MPEVYDARDGNVIDPCACNDSLVPPVSSLPTECISPDGSNCDWYKHCLERKYSCRGIATEYLLNYGTIFCNLYIKYKNVFTDRALCWINDGRKCLQLALVSFIRPFINGTCKEIHDEAFDVYKSCNIKPYLEGGSICDMIKSEYNVSISTEAYVWLQNALDTFYECQKDAQANDFGRIYQEFKLTVDLIQTSWDNHMDLNKDQFNQIVVNIVHGISKLLIAPPER
jgi:hypothetical protein